MKSFPLQKGLFVVFEGIDGSGKTSIAQGLYQQLIASSFPALLTKEPGGSPLGTTLRKILQEQKSALNEKTEFLLFAADRAQHIQEVIIPALHDKKIIICDRFTDSSVVYQGYGRGICQEMIKKINDWVTQSIKPDIIFYIVIDSITAQKRMQQRGKLSSFDKESIDFFERLLQGYEQEFFNAPHVIKLDGKQPLNNLIEQTFNYLITWIHTHAAPTNSIIHKRA